MGEILVALIYIFVGFQVANILDCAVMRARNNDQRMTSTIFFLVMLLWPVAIVWGIGSLIKLWTRK